MTTTSTAPSEAAAPTPVRLGALEAPSAVQLAAALAHSAAVVAREPELSGVVAAILAQVVETFGARVAHVYLADEARRELRAAAEHEAPELLDRLALIPYEAPLLAAKAAATREVQSIEDLQTAEGWPLAKELMLPRGVRSILSAPLLAGGRLVGVVTMGLGWPHAFDAAERDAFRAVGEVFAAGIANAQSREAEATARRHLEAVLDAVLAMGEADEPGEVARRAAEGARAVSRAQAAAVALAAEPGGPPTWAFSGGDEHLGAAIAAGDGPAANRDFGIAHAGAAFGRLYVAEPPSGAFGEHDVRALELLAQHAGLILEHARVRARLEREVAVRRRIEADLRESEESFRLLVEGVPDLAMTLLDQRGHVATWNSGAERVTGYGGEEMVGTSAARLYPPEATVARLPERHLAEAAQAGRFSEVAERMRKDGSRFLAEVSIAPLRSDAGDLRGYAVVMRDVTARRRLEEAAARDRAWLAAVIESAPVSIVLFEGSTTLERISFNRRAAELFGRPFDPERGPLLAFGMLHRPDASPVPANDMPAVRALHGERIEEEEFLFRKTDGTMVPVLLGASPIVGPEGKVVGAVLAYQDVSALKRLERQREEWTSVVAHDLRQPVNAIALTAQVLQKAHLRPGAAQIASKAVLDSVRQLDRMIADLLDASRLEARRLTVEKREVDVGELARTVAARTVAPELGRPVNVEVPPRLVAQVDSDRIAQVLANLLTNAVKYGDPGTPIDVAVEDRREELVVTVSNRGPGIPRDELSGLFRRFHRTDEARRGGAPGLGLGLYIARGIVEAHGGRIWAESRADGLVSFRFTLPAP